MTLTPQAEARITEHIRRLAPRRGAASSRSELHAHVADAAESLAGARPATPAHVDAAVAALGDDAAIRAAFFPASPRFPVDRLGIALAALAVVAAAVAIAADGGGRASCRVEGEGSCEASSSGDVLELAVWSLPPLLVLAALALAPPVVGVAVAGLYLLVGLARAIDSATITGPGWDLLLPVAGALSLAVAVRHLRRARKAGAASEVAA